MRGRLRLDNLRTAIATSAGEPAALAKVGARWRLCSLLARLGLAHAPALAALELGAGLGPGLRLGLRLSLRLRAFRARAGLFGARRLGLDLSLVAPVARLRQGGSRHQRQGQRHKGDALHAVTPIGPR